MYLRSRHALSHLPADVLRFGPLDDFSSFKFENFLFRLKNMVKSGNKPLEQIRNKYLQFVNLKNKVSTADEISFLHQYSPNEADKLNVPDYENFDFFRIITFSEGVSLKIGTIRDSFCSIEDEEFIKLMYILRNQNNSDVYLAGKKFSIKTNAYIYPGDSSLVGIYEVGMLSSLMYRYSLLRMPKKYFAMQLDNVEEFFLV